MVCTSSCPINLHVQKTLDNKISQQVQCLLVFQNFTHKTPLSFGNPDLQAPPTPFLWNSKMLSMVTVFYGLTQYDQ